MSASEKMKPDEFLSHVQSLGITLRADGDNLRFSAPRGVLTPALRVELAERKAELLTLVRIPRAAAVPDVPVPPTVPTPTCIAPRTPSEEVLAGIWSQVLGLHHVGIYDNFFEIGGDSILATRVVSRLCDVFQTKLSLRSFFENPTVAELARIAGDRSEEGSYRDNITSVRDLEEGGL
jgi:hypothetical protein